MFVRRALLLGRGCRRGVVGRVRRSAPSHARVLLRVVLAMRAGRRGPWCGGCRPAQRSGRGGRAGRTCRRGRSRGAACRRRPRSASPRSAPPARSGRRGACGRPSPPRSSRMTVVSLPTWMAPVFARATSASRVSVCPASAGLSAPRRSAVEPDTATPIVSRPACCSARAAASITTPLPVPAGPTSTAARSGPVRTSSAWCCSGLSGPPMRSATSRAALSRANVADVSACGLGELCGAAFDRLLLRAYRQRGHPPALQESARAGRGPSPGRRRAPDPVPSLRRLAPARPRAGRAPRRRRAARSASPRHDPRSRARLRAARMRRSAARPHRGRIRDRGRSAVHTRCRSERVVSSLDRRFSSARLRSSPRSGARP